MANLMDNAHFNVCSNVPNNINTQGDLSYIIQQARQNPQAFEDEIRRINPQGYEKALRIRNSSNPRAIIMQMAKERGLNPNILQMLGIK